MNENINFSIFQGKFNKIEYRIFFLVFLILQFLLVFIGGKNGGLSDIAFFLHVLLGFLVYFISVKRYRDIGEKYPFFIALMLFVPVVGFLAIYDLLTKKSFTNNNSHLESTMFRVEHKSKPKKKIKLIIKICCVVVIIVVVGILISM